jgi:hypothetical protein
MDLFGFAAVEGRKVVAVFDGGTITSKAGAMLLGATDRRIGLVERFAGCFTDHRSADLIERWVARLVRQRVFGPALGGTCLRAGEAGSRGGSDRPRLTALIHEHIRDSLAGVA